jgi:biopolymer transport protein ExbD
MRRFKAKRRRPELNAAINVTNLTDVALTLLIAFMVIAPFIEHSIRVQLPKAEEKELSEPDQLTVEIGPDRTIRYNGVVTPLDQLGDVLAAFAGRTDIAVNVRGDASISFQELVDVLDVVRKAGIVRIGLATEVKVEN